MSVTIGQKNYSIDTTTKIDLFTGQGDEYDSFETLPDNIGVCPIQQDRFLSVSLIDYLNVRQAKNK